MVESCFGSSGQQLTVPGRVLVGEGVLTKMCRKRSKARQFFLFNDILVYGNIMISKKKYNKQHIIPLEEVELQGLEDSGREYLSHNHLLSIALPHGACLSELRNGWLIRTTTKSFAVYAATATEKQEWMAHINRCIEDLLRKSGKKPVANHAAVWVPDNEANVCMHCKKTQFTMLVRRVSQSVGGGGCSEGNATIQSLPFQHHCRNCGGVVCGPCSSKKFLLPQQSSKALRVCLDCYDSLSQSKTEKVRDARKGPGSAQKSE